MTSAQDLCRLIRRTRVSAPLGHFALTLRPASWSTLFTALFAGGAPAAEIVFCDVGCGLGHAVFIARNVYGVSKARGVDFSAEVESAKLCRSRLGLLHVDFDVDDLTLPSFHLRGCTHAICLIDNVHLMETFIDVAQRDGLMKIAFMVTRDMVKEVRHNEYGFRSSCTFAVTLEGGGTRRTVCVADLLR